MSVDESAGCVAVGGNKYSLAKVRAHFGAEACPSVAVSRQWGHRALAACHCPAEEGHGVKGKAHVVNAKAKRKFLDDEKSFLLDPSANPKPAPSGSKASSGGSGLSTATRPLNP